MIILVETSIKKNRFFSFGVPSCVGGGCLFRIRLGAFFGAEPLCILCIGQKAVFKFQKVSDTKKTESFMYYEFQNFAVLKICKYKHAKTYNRESVDGGVKYGTIRPLFIVSDHVSIINPIS